MRHWHLQPAVSLTLVIAASLFGTGAPARAGYVATELGNSQSLARSLGAAETAPVLGMEGSLDVDPVLDGTEGAPAQSPGGREPLSRTASWLGVGGLARAPGGLAGSPDSGSVNGPTGQPLCLLPRPQLPTAEAVGMLLTHKCWDRLSPFAARLFRPPRCAAWGTCAA